MFPNNLFDQYDRRRLSKKFSLDHEPHRTLMRNHYIIPNSKHNSHQYHQTPEYDLRLIVIRHGERVDTVFGNDWFEQAFGPAPSFSILPAGRNSILPNKLPHRNQQFHYILDPPITKKGQNLALLKGQQLLSMFGPIDKCYSSPASRCVLTADAILNGMYQVNIPIKVDRYLFEPLSWNTALLGFSDINPFLSKKDWKKAGINIDHHYQPIGRGLSRRDDEAEFIRRTNAMVQVLTKDHSKNHHSIMSNSGFPRKQTILVVGHSASPITFQGIIAHSGLNPSDLWTQARNIDLLDALVFDRNPVTQRWSMVKVPNSSQ